MACASTELTADDEEGSGGKKASGGNGSGGAASGSGGKSGSGGAKSSGGSASGGTSAGGTAHSGGGPASGGNASSGGSADGGAASGGRVGSGGSATSGGAGSGGALAGACAGKPTYAAWKNSEEPAEGDQIVHQCTVIQSTCQGLKLKTDYLFECNQSHVNNCLTQRPEDGQSWTYLGECVSEVPGVGGGATGGAGLGGEGS
jgi:hypothetical protein